jgi:hypothetical protein
MAQTVEDISCITKLYVALPHASLMPACMLPMIAVHHA